MIIKQLAYKVTLQAQEFLNGKKKVTEEVANLNDSISQNNKKSAGSFKSLNNSISEMGRVSKNSFSLAQTGAAKFLGVALTLEGARRMFMGTTEQLVRMGNTAGFLGMSTKALDGFTKASESYGASAESTASHLMKLKNAQLIMRTGLGPPDETTRQLMMLGVDVMGNKSPDELMLEEARALRRLPKEQSQVMAGNLGIDTDLYQAMMSPDYEKRVKQYTANSNSTDDAVKKAREVTKALAQLNQSIDGVGSSLVMAFGPQVTDSLNTLASWVTEHKDDFTSFFSNASKGANEFIDALNGVHNHLASALQFGDFNLITGFKKPALNLPDLIKENKSYSFDDLKSVVLGKKKLSEVGTKGESQSLGDMFSKVLDRVIPSAKASESTPNISSLTNKKYNINNIKDLSDDSENSPNNGVDRKSLLGAVMMTESGGDPNARSKAGAVGAFQLMPGTARDYGLIVNDKVDERLDPEKSAIAANAHISRLLKKYNGNVQNAMRAYNWGEGNMDSYLKTGHGIITKSNPTGAMPKETVDYSGKVAAYYSKITRDAMAKPSQSRYDNSQTNSTHIANVTVNSNPQTVDQLTSAIEQQAARSRVTVSFSGGPS